MSIDSPPVLPPVFGKPQGEPPSPDEAAAALASLESSQVPVIDPSPETTVELPGGLIFDGRLIQTATVRELNGWDEEKISRLDINKNMAVFVTELLMLGVEELAGGEPPKDMIRGLLMGDRDELLLGIRKASYGSEIEYKLTCSECEQESDIIVDIDEDIPRQKMVDPLTRVFDVPLRKGGVAHVQLLTGVAQEAFSENIGRKTQAEINTIMLAKSVLEINGVPTFGQEDEVRRLSAGDRAAVAKFLDEHRPGPQFNAIDVPCATCGTKYPIFVGMPNLFRF